MANATTYAPPFNQCPAIGHAPSCKILIVVNTDRSVSVLDDPSVGPYDGSDDTSVGIQNDSSAPVDAITVTGQASGLGRFDQDGICTFTFTGNGYCSSLPAGANGYEGSRNSFVTDPSLPDSAEVDFPGGGLGAGQATYFSLEGVLTAASLTARQGHLAGCGRAPTGPPTDPSFTVTVQRGNTHGTATGTGWAQNTTIDVYLDTGAGAYYIGTSKANASGQFATTLANFSRFLPKGAARQASPDERFPLVAMDGSCDAATIRTLTATNTRARTLKSSDHTSNGGCQASGLGISTNPQPAPPALPLRTQGRWIIDSSGHRLKLASVNWYGAEEADFVPGGLQCQSVDQIASEIAGMGFNSVRLPWSNAMYEQNPSICTSADLGVRPCIPPEVLAANPTIGQSARPIFTAVVNALAKNHVMVILDDHSTSTGFVSAPSEGVWWGGQYWDQIYGYQQKIARRTQRWINDWVGMVSIFNSQPAVVGADLRNEPGACSGSCPTVTWDCSDAVNAQNWRAAADAAGNRILRNNKHLLILVDGTETASDLTGVHDCPAVLRVGHQLVYSAHSYRNFVNPQQGYIGYKDLSTQLGKKWGFILTQHKRWTAPVWVGEFGADTARIGPAAPGVDCGHNTGSVANEWLSCFMEYLAKADIDWAWWSLNGTESDGGPFHADRTFYDAESYGLLAPDWSKDSSLFVVHDLQGLQAKVEGP